MFNNRIKTKKDRSSGSVSFMITYDILQPHTTTFLITTST